MISWAVVLEFCRRRQEIERSAIKTERELYLGLVGVADDVGGSPIRRGHGLLYRGEALGLKSTVVEKDSESCGNERLHTGQQELDSEDISTKHVANDLID